ncbi:MAG: EAL domain-containing protein [Hyphomicrobiaceae bacterium]|nr:EAL domain-containing protein [Hyphomicrobiaceae bacterium]
MKTARPPSEVASIEPVGGGPVAADAAQTEEMGTPAESGQARERIVMVMMALVAMAVGGVAHVHLGYAAAGAATAGLLAFAMFMAINGMLVRAGEIARLRAEVVRLEHEMARIKSHGVPLSATPVRQGGPASGHVDLRASWPQAKPGVSAEGRAAPRADTQAGYQVPATAEARAPEQRSNIPGANSAMPSSAVPRAPSGAPRPFEGRPDETAMGADDAEAFPQSPLKPDARWEPSQVNRHARFVPPKSGPAPAGALQSGSPPPRDPPRAHAPQRPASPVERREEHGRGAEPTVGPDLVEMPDWSGASQTTSEALRDAWSFRPTDTGASREFAPGGDGEGDARAPHLPHVRSVEADLELVQRKIKALADEVNANEALRIAHAADHGAASEPMQHQSGGYHGASGIEESVAALRTTAHRMQQPKPASEPAQGGAFGERKAKVNKLSVPATAPPQQAPLQSGALPSLDALIPASAQPIAVSRDEEPYDDDADDMHEQQQALPSRSPAEPRSQQQPAAPRSVAMEPPHRGQDQTLPNERTPIGQRAQLGDGRLAAPTPIPDRKLSEIAAAIETSRMDVFLKPIVGLGDYAVAHFEVDVRLKSPTGSFIDGVVETLSVGASEMLGLFDIERLNRTARVADQLESRGKTGSLLAPTAGHSMTDGKFLEAFARKFEERMSISGQLVLTFTQADVAAFGAGTWQALSDMNSFGFRFALSEVTHLATDFAALAERGFAFVKLPAEAFLDGMATGHGMVPPADICRHMAEAGLTLVVEAIDDQTQLAKVFGFGALFGQGQLFGGARQITLESLAERRTAAA